MLLSCILMVGCSSPIRMQVRQPDPPVATAASGIEADRLRTRCGTLAAGAGELLDGIRLLEARVAKGDRDATTAYNYLVGCLIGDLQRRGISPWGREVTLSGPSGDWKLVGEAPANLGGHLLLATQTLEFRGRHAQPQPILRPGIGAPVVAMMPQRARLLRHPEPLARRYLSLTAVVRFKGQTAHLCLFEPYTTRHVPLGGRDLPLAMDYSSGISVALSREKLDLFGLARTFLPQRYADTARLQMIRPYEPERIPVVLVHGLRDTPATWMPMYLGLMRDPEIRKHYQFWLFSYPTGYPITHSAMVLRRELERTRHRHPDHKDMIIVGHSMGGIVSRLLITDAGESLWHGLLGSAPAQTPLFGRNRELLEEALLFDARDDIARAVFLCTPHRGSELATNWIGRAAARLVRAPLLITETATAVSRLLGIDPVSHGMGQSPNSITSLSPQSPTLRCIELLPIRSTIPYHSMMGDRGKGDTPDSSDGVVTYHSAHLDGSASEAIIPADHGAHQHPQAIAEMRRILLEHLKAGSRSAASQ